MAIRLIRNKRGKKYLLLIMLIVEMAPQSLQMYI